MAWNKYEQNLDDPNFKSSSWNAAAFKMKRLHQIMESMNELDDNLIAWNPEKANYNFMLKFSKCENLYQEVESKLTDAERKDVEEMRKAIRKFIQDFPVIIKKRQKIYPYREETKIDYKVLSVLTEWLSLYETKCRALVDMHGMDTAYDDEEDGY